MWYSLLLFLFIAYFQLIINYFEFFKKSFFSHSTIVMYDFQFNDCRLFFLSDLFR